MDVDIFAATTPVNVTTLRDHTCDGIAHAAGETYDAPAWSLETLIRNGYAYPTAHYPNPPDTPAP